MSAVALLDNNTSLPFGSITIYRVVNAVSSAAEAAILWRRARQTRAVLNALSDHELNDIGLTRGQIDDAVMGLGSRRA
jgi:uncharacterized protein YjiS (DUF1127 family)